ncbi:SGNH/GDSL hydrolase family protein [Sulfitobacter sp. JB4-11]|uniref:SGNH/GDSL hydrolase family protein n=1 Tax=Sulfitobacter rhodophyticola TaxID=3238304 RepID=UPI003D813004
MRLIALLFSVLLSAPAQAEDFVSPDIVILGDSQIPFGSGPVFLEFFENIKAHCPPTPQQQRDLKKLGDMTVAVIGVRSTSLHSWTARKGGGKGSICNVDKKWKANAGAFGFINRSSHKYVQIGRGKPYQFCKPGKSAFEAMFAPGYYQPRLLLMSFLGNATKRWGESPEKALDDVRKTMAQIPEGTPCIFMTTAPAYSEKIVKRRLKAQASIKWAFEEANAACTFIEGATPATVAANQGNKHYFRLNKSGRVKDPFHPNEKAAKNFFAIEMDTICTAIYDEIGDALADPS